jgi:hypothetical protein
LEDSAVIALEEKTGVVDRKGLQGIKNLLKALSRDFKSKPLH